MGLELGFTPMTVVDDDEYSKFMGLDLDQLELTSDDGHDELFLLATDLPDSVDNSKHHIIKEQGTCGSCYCFSALSGIEDTISFKTGQQLNLSR